MTPWSWVYLCNNVEYFRLMCRKLPVEPFEGLNSVLVLTNERNAALQPELQRVLNAYQPINPNLRNVEFALDDVIIETVINRLQLRSDALAAVRQYALFVKLCIPYFSRVWKCRILFTDDDVVCLRNPRDLMQGEREFASKTHLDQLGDNNLGWDQADAMEDIFGLSNYTPFDYDALHTDAGIWSCDPIDNAYLTYLEAFWNHPVFAGLHQRIPHRKTYLRCFDQRFLTGYFMKRHAIFTAKSEYRRNTVQKLHKEVGNNLRWPYPNKVPLFIHYGASTQKPLFVQWITDNIPDGKDRSDVPYV